VSHKHPRRRVDLPDVPVEVYVTLGIPAEGHQGREVEASDLQREAVELHEGFVVIAGDRPPAGRALAPAPR
jgi:hypothetical protein